MTGAEINGISQIGFNTIGRPNKCFSLETYAHIEDGSLIEYSKTVFRGDYAHFIIERNYD
jgi:DNA-binding GntR family transcriptional regulator